MKKIIIGIVILLLLAIPLVSSEIEKPKSTEWTKCSNGLQHRFTYGECIAVSIKDKKERCSQWAKIKEERKCEMPVIPEEPSVSRGSSKRNRYNLDNSDNIEIEVKRGKRSFIYNGERYYVKYFINILGNPVITFYKDGNHYFPIHPTHLEGNLKKDLSELSYIQEANRGKVKIAIYKKVG